MTEKLLRRYWTDRPGRYVWTVALALAAKVLIARWLILGHAAGFGALPDLLFIGGLAAFFSLFRGRAARITFAGIHLFMSIAFVGMALYVSSFEQIPSAQSLMFSKQAAEVGPAILTLLSWRYLLLLIDIPLVGWLALKDHTVSAEHKWRRIVFSAGSMTLVGAFSVTLAVLPVSGGNLVASYWYGLVPDQIAVSFLSSMTPKTAVPAKPSDLQSTIDDLSGRRSQGRISGAPAPGAYRGSNLIVIQVEALQASLIGAQVDGQPVTPNLNALISRSYYFPNTYSQIGPGNTSDAEFISNTSLYPSEQEASSVEYAKKELPSLPRLLGKAGYASITFHTNDVQFWNRFQLYPALGFSDYADRSYFGNEDIVGMAASDKMLFEKSLPIIEGRASAEHPLYAQLITLSSHYPFKGIDGRAPLKLRPEYANSITGKYLLAQSYTDQQIGEFITYLEQDGMLDNSIIVVYGDHFGMRFENTTDVDAKLRYALLGRDYNRADYYNIPLIVHLPKQAAPVVDRNVTGQIDIMPTMADLLGVSLADTPHFGRSVFERTPTLLTRPSSIPTLIDDHQVYLGGIDGTADQWFSSHSRKPWSTGTVPSTLEDARKLVELSAAYTLKLPDRPDSVDATGVIPTAGTDITKSPFQ